MLNGEVYLDREEVLLLLNFHHDEIEKELLREGDNDGEAFYHAEQLGEYAALLSELLGGY